VNLHQRVERSRVATGEHNDHRNAGLAARREHQTVAFPRTCRRQSQTANLILVMHVAARDVERYLRFRRKHVRECGTEAVEVFTVANAALETNIQRSARLEGWIVVLGVDREGEHTLVALKERGRTVAVVRVAVDDGRALDAAGALQQAYPQGDVIEETKTLAVIVERVVKAAADVAGNAA